MKLQAEQANTNRKVEIALNNFMVLDLKLQTKQPTINHDAEIMGTPPHGFLEALSAWIYPCCQTPHCRVFFILLLRAPIWKSVSRAYARGLRLYISQENAAVFAGAVNHEESKMRPERFELPTF
jgi:hypothetical protein